MKHEALRKSLALALIAALLAAQPGFVFAGNVVSGQVSAEGGQSANSSAAVGGNSPTALPKLEVGLLAPANLSGSLSGASLTVPVVKAGLDPSVIAPQAPVEVKTVLQAPVSAPISRTAPAAAAVPSAGSGQFVANATLSGPAPAVAPLQGESLRRVSATLPVRLAAPFEKKAVDPAIGTEPEFPAEAPKSLAEASVAIDPNRAYTASPEDWRDEVMYSVFLDRFARSPQGKPMGDPKSGNTRHGGDLRGLIDKLDYIQGSGVTTIILNPVVLGIPEAYHGYAPLHLLAVDPQLGTMADFKELVAKAHQRGLRVVFDLLINHVGPVFEYKDGSQWRGLDQAPKEIGVWNHKLFPTEMTAPENFTRHGVIGNWDDHDQAINGDFPPNYRHWASEKPEVQEKLIHMAQWWLKETDIDGFRIDAIRHINPAFRVRFTKEVREYAAKLGKKNLFILGENSTGVDGDVARDLNEAGIDSAYAYPEYRRLNWALHGKAPARAIEDSLKQAMSVLGSSVSRLLRFIDLHDTYRFLRNGEPVSVLKMAMAFLLFSTGIPLIYYGTEQAFRQTTDRLDPEGPWLPADPENRPDMFADGQYKFPSSAGDKFDTHAPTYLWLKQLADLRKAHPALSRGEQYVRWSDQNGAGIYAFSRIYKGEEVLVVLNTATEARSADMYVDGSLTPAGTVLEDAVDPANKAKAYAPQEGGAKVWVQVPPHGVRVFVKSKAK
ncbi:MAG: alpha-amylase family glycosyl hydrolase [Elusimicrobia bacterium]|nr:alpha-amylase family glycosyl hydrolase [Elusimicrobiota bacterium]